MSSGSISQQPNPRRFRLPLLQLGAAGLFLLAMFFAIGTYVAYSFFCINVPAKHIAVLTKKTGEDLSNQQEIAPGPEFKGIQTTVLSEGRHFRNPFDWDWEIYPMVEIPEGKMGVRVRLHGDDLSEGHFVATQETEKGIIPQELTPGRYAINAKVVDKATGRDVLSRNKADYAEIIELHEPVTIPAGYKGVVTNLSGPLPEKPNQLLVPAGQRGVQEKPLDEGTYYMNPYMYRIELVDCRSQRFNLSENYDMGFPSKDGFWVSLDGIIEFRVKPEMAARVYVTYNELENDQNKVHALDQELIKKVIMPNTRSFCRLRGSNASGRDFISGETRSAFQAEFQEAIRTTCEEQGIEIIQALITRINPPQAIASPVRDREVANQQMKQYQQEKLQQDQEAKLATEKAMVDQKKRMVGSEREVIKLTTEAKRRQEVALAEATRDKEVAVEELAAAKDRAAAVLSQKTAEAAKVRFENEATAAGWKRSVEAFNGDGSAFARYTLYQKLAPGFRSIMTNTADSPLMEMFRGLQSDSAPATLPQPSPADK
jgi:regulator of protease activity HflC (stomatin/prohibitin superfamily)